MNDYASNYRKRSCTSAFAFRFCARKRLIIDCKNDRKMAFEFTPERNRNCSVLYVFLARLADTLDRISLACMKRATLSSRLFSPLLCNCNIQSNSKKVEILEDIGALVPLLILFLISLLREKRYRVHRAKQLLLSNASLSHCHYNYSGDYKCNN